MESFSSSELTRRDFASIGSAGGPKLQRRIDFAEMLLSDMSSLLQICGKIKAREDTKIKDMGILKDMIDTAYFPVPAMLWPIFDKARV